MRALLHDSKIARVVLDLPLFLLEELLGPDGGILEIDIVRQDVVKVNSILLLIFESELVLALSVVDLLLAEGVTLEVAFFLVV